jgi:hypothetical protein
MKTNSIENLSICAYEGKRSLIRQFFLSQMEQVTIPQLIIQYAAQRNGKPVIERDIPKLNDLTGRKWHIVKHFGWTDLQDDGYLYKKDGEDNYSIQLERSERNVIWNPEWIQLNNACYYSARIERNLQREKGTKDADYQDHLANCLAKLQDAVKEIEKQAEILKCLTAYEQPGGPDSHTIYKLAGLNQVHPNTLGGAKVAIGY